MSSKIIRMQRPAQGDLTEMAALLCREMRASAELVAESCREGGNSTAIMLNFEKYYFRNGSYAALAVLLTEADGRQTADIVGSGGGGGLLNISWGANAEFADDAAALLARNGFSEQ